MPPLRRAERGRTGAWPPTARRRPPKQGAWRQAPRRCGGRQAPQISRHNMKLALRQQRAPQRPAHTCKLAFGCLLGCVMPPKWMDLHIQLQVDHARGLAGQAHAVRQQPAWRREAAGMAASRQLMTSRHELAFHRQAKRVSLPLELETESAEEVQLVTTFRMHRTCMVGQIPTPGRLVSLPKQNWNTQFWWYSTQFWWYSTCCRRSFNTAVHHGCSEILFWAWHRAVWRTSTAC